MSHIRVNRWGLSALVVLVSLGVLWPALAQRSTDRSVDDVLRAREIVALLEQGQIDLTDATKIAEKHVAGNAVRAECQVRMSTGKPGERGTPAGSSADQDGRVAKRLVYDVSCFNKEKSKVHAVQVDGLTKEVIEVD